ncbi:MAG TPA: leucine-rich repeat domain-containing protein, partial [Bacteroidales bacterium]|nr:leucine-rich repeat domain-containing protein [Bacteroidales bacterium]
KKHVEITFQEANHPFYNIKPRDSISIPKSVTNNGVTYYINSIGNKAFWGCVNLSSINLPNSIVSIGDNAFDYCISLKTINLPKSIISIGKDAFWGCISLVSISLPSSTKSIGENAFKYCISLDSVTFNPISCNYMGSFKHPVFENTNKVTTLIIGDKVESIPDYAFYHFTKIHDVDFPNSLISIGKSAFDSCYYLKSITLPNALTSIGDNAFRNCSGLRSVIFNSENCNYFGSDKALVFESCEKITFLIIGNDVTNIPSYSFKGIPNLKSIYLNPIKPPKSQSSSFEGLSKMTLLSVSCISLEDYKTSDNWNKFTNYRVIKKTHTINTSICQGEFYKDYGVEIDSAGTYHIIHTCDSVILNLSIKPISTKSLEDSICQGETYSNFGFNFIADKSEVYTQNLQKANGCDSIITLSLKVNPTQTTSFKATICQGKTYNLNGFNERKTGLYTQELKTNKGCDSIVNLNLIVNPTYNDSIYKIICQRETYNLNGFNERTDGFYTQNLQTINGCDSIVNLILIVKPVYNDTISAIICQGERYNKFGFNHSIKGTYTQYLKTINGCDSIITLKLNLNPTYNINFDAVICKRETYNLNGFNERETGL